MKTLSSVLDRRLSKGKSAENRRKFLERVRDSVREAMPNIINNGSLKDIAKGGGKVEVKRNTIQEPAFRFGKGGSNEHVLPGNKEYIEGDQIKKDGGQGKGQGKKGGDGEGGEDPFIVEISREEFLNYFFEDLELPDLVRKDLSEVTETRYRTAGFSTTGTPAKLAIVRSMKMAHQRRIASRGAADEELERIREQLEEQGLAEEALAREGEAGPGDAEQALLDEASRLRLRREAIPFIDPMDLRYRTTKAEQTPITSATMVCIMDNSGSMQEREKTLARKFFYLLYLFLDRKYDKITLIFIHHTEKAKEVLEQEFFNTRETGGTVVSTALELFAKMIPERVNPSKSNIYVCQCSDGDNMNSDNAKCQALLKEKLLPFVQYWAYIQIESESFTGANEASKDSLWAAYEAVSQGRKAMAMRHVSKDADIYPVFRNLFEKRKSAGARSDR